jgi:hypothetical protein
MFIKPTPGLVVRDPVTRAPLPADGREVDPNENGGHWLRELRDGSVFVAEPPPEPGQESHEAGDGAVS